LEKYPGLIAVVTHHRAERLMKAWKSGDYSTEGVCIMKEFNNKGEHTGHCEEIYIPQSRLASAVKALGGKSEPKTAKLAAVLAYP
jgi:hypothetical protein